MGSFTPHAYTHITMQTPHLTPLLCPLLLLTLTSCACEVPSMPLSHVPTGILILAFIGLVTVVLLLFGIIIVMGGLMERD